MATKADFTEDEWETMRKGVTGAGMLVSIGDRDFTDTFGEVGALAKRLSEERKESHSQLMRELADSPKEQAELTMILDVERNDLGRICVPGSVRRLTGPRIETHPTIHHRGAVLGGDLRDGVTMLGVLRSMFPSGSVTGAPKVRAMEIIDELEPHRRGPYGGAVGYVDFTGSMDTCIALRTLVLKGQTAYLLRSPLAVVYRSAHWK